ncbi:MAG: Ig-like domain-containing protein [Pseudomonadota bacterium]
MPPFRRPTPLAALTAALFAHTALADAPPGGTLAYQSDRSQVGIGVSSQGDLLAELKYLLQADLSHATVGELWASDGAGGLKLSRHWIPAEASGKPDRSQAMRKLFLALDQNSHHDRKLSLGGGLETERGYLAAYLSRGITGRRDLADRQTVETFDVTGDDGRPYLDTTTRITTLHAFERPFDWGIGLRAGRHFPAPGIHLSAGLDHEWGQDSARQTTLSLELEKQFAASPWSIAARAEAQLSDNGIVPRDEETQAWLILRYAFGEPRRTPTTYTVRSLDSVAPAVAAEPSQAKLATQHTAMDVQQSGAWKAEQASSPAVQEPPAQVYREVTEKRLVKTTASMRSDAFFKFDSAKLTPVASESLGQVARVLTTQGYADRISVTGHTCDIGPEAYNQKLSLRRAESVKGFLVKEGGLPATDIDAAGKGETAPLYPNTRTERHKNRRVDIEFLTYVDKEALFTVRELVAAPEAPQTTQTPTYQADAATAVARAPEPAAPAPAIEIRREEVEAEPAWIQRGLFSTLTHKRTVDVYRVTRESVETHTERTYLNRNPAAGNDNFSAANGQPVSMAVLGNDSDPDQDGLSITAVGQPSLGTAVVSGDRIVYTPSSATVTGTDSFTYTISDGQGGTATAQVSVQLIANQAPTAVADSYRVPGVVNRALDVLGNDLDPEGDPLTITSFSQPGHGEVSLVDNMLWYASSSSFSSVFFTYTISDPYGGTASATVTLIDP